MPLNWVPSLGGGGQWAVLVQLQLPAEVLVGAHSYLNARV